MGERESGRNFGKTKKRNDDGQNVAGAGRETTGERSHTQTHT